MASIIQQNPTARWVWLTIGGNDCIAGLPQRIPISVMMAELTAALTTIVTEILKASSTIKIVQFGYDLLGWDKMGQCVKMGDDIFYM